MSFEIYYQVKHPRGSLFQVHLQAFLEDFSWCLSSYSVDDTLVPATEESNSTVDATIEVLKTRKEESCSLQVCKFLMRNISEYFFPANFFMIQRTFKKFGLEFSFSSVANYTLQLLLKREFSKFPEKLLFRTYHACVRFLDRVAKRRSSCYLL